MSNPIIDEIREARAALAAEHGYDLERINEWARKQTELRRQQRENQAVSQAAETTVVPPSQSTPGE